jgi:hypothetical protein
MIRRSILPEGLPDARVFTLEDGGWRLCPGMTGENFLKTRQNA